MVAERKNILMKVMSVFMALVMCFTFVVPVIAATSKTISIRSGTQVVKITTGKGWLYSLGLKKTTVTVTNTGNHEVCLYKNIGNVGYSWQGNLAPGQTKKYTAKGSGKNYSVKLQGLGKNTTVKVSVSAGSVS